MTPLILCCAAIVVTAPLGWCALYLRRIAQEARAIRAVLQARWDYDRISVESPSPAKTSPFLCFGSFATVGGNITGKES